MVLVRKPGGFGVLFSEFHDEFGHLGCTLQDDQPDLPEGGWFGLGELADGLGTRPRTWLFGWRSGEILFA